MAFILIKASDQSKYVTLLKEFVSQFSLGDDQYQKTIKISTDVLSNHRLDPKFFENKREKNYSDKARNDTEDEKRTATRFSQKDVICYCCGEKGHIAPCCPKKKSTSNYQWYVNRAM